MLPLFKKENYFILLIENLQVLDIKELNLQMLNIYLKGLFLMKLFYQDIRKSIFLH
jgi:hypothetical protein